MFFKSLLCVILTLFSVPSFISAQEFILRPTPGREIVLAVDDVDPGSNEISSELWDAIQAFNQVLWNDLSFSGYFTMASKSYYPSQSTGLQSEEEIPYDAWAALPFPITFLSAGTMEIRDEGLYVVLQIKVRLTMNY